MKPISLLALLLAACEPSATDDKPAADDTGESSAPSDADGDGVTAPVDCDDFNSIVHPYMDESCDGVDNDCDGLVDAEDADCTDALTVYEDADGDSFGDPAWISTTCALAAGTAENADDCDDANATIHPGADELCDDAEVDEDCDGLIDDADDAVSGTSSWYSDADGDGYGDPSVTVEGCAQPASSSTDATDCDDSDADVHPDASEICDALGVDEDCDGLVNGDDDVGGMLTWYQDADGDGWGDESDTTVACEAPDGYTATAGDCDDAEDQINPDEDEVCDGAGTDEDCDGLVNDEDDSPVGGDRYYADADADDYGDGGSVTVACTQPDGTVDNNEDCDDTESAINPDADELCDPLDIDEDCDGLVEEADPSATGLSAFYSDADADGYGEEGATVEACEASAGLIDVGGDCDDSDAAVFPGAAEVCGDSVDDNCDDWVPDCGPSGDHDIADAAYATMVADSSGDGLSGGSGLWRAGDLNSDGYDDVIVGAYLADGAAASSGAAYVVYGQAEGTFSVSDADMVLDGGAAEDYFGYATLGGEDLNGDDAVDLLVSAYNNDTYKSNAGAVYLFDGPADAAMEWRDADTTFYGPTPSDYFGKAIAVGDLNGDGATDLHGTGLEGAWAWLGPFSTATEIATSADLTLSMSDTWASYFRPAAAIDDLDGDGFGELIQAADITGWEDYMGYEWPFEYMGAFFFAGGSAGAIDINEDADAIVSTDAVDEFGYLINSGGDLDGDGNNDVAITARIVDSSSAELAGAVYVYTGGIPGTGAPSDEATAVLSGTERYHLFGYSTDLMGDFDGDGTSDLLVGAAGENGTATDAGAVYLFYGPLFGSLGPGDADASWDGDISGDYLGGSVISAGDTNGDGLEDLVFGATGVDDGGADGGAAYFLLGG